MSKNSIYIVDLIPLTDTDEAHCIAGHNIAAAIRRHRFKNLDTETVALFSDIAGEFEEAADYHSFELCLRGFYALCEQFGVNAQ